MKINPSKTLLLIIDMQKDFYAEGGNAVRRFKPVTHMQALPAKITDFAHKLRNAGVTVVFTKFLYDPYRNPQNYTSIISTTKKSNWMCKRGTEGAEFAGVQPRDNDIVLEKFSYDCFAETNLLQICKEEAIDTILITGVRTEICVTHTACRSFAEGFNTVIVSDLVGTYDNKEETAKTILEVLKYASLIIQSHEIKFERST